MSALSITLIALSLSLDSFAVSVAIGASHKAPRLSTALKVALLFGLFQMAMPIAGWFMGQGVKEILYRTDHWAAFGLLLALGAKMIYEALRKDCSESSKTDISHPRVLFALAFATSIDALVMGLSLALLKVPLFTPAAIIGATTFVMCFLAFYIGKNCGCFLKSKFEMAGGLVLIVLGVKILVEHLFF